MLIDYFNKPHAFDKIIYKVNHYPDFEIDTNSAQGVCDYLDVREYKFSPLLTCKGHKKFLTEKEVGKILKDPSKLAILMPTWKPIQSRSQIEYYDPSDPRAIKSGPRHGRVRYYIARYQYNNNKKVYEIPMPKGLWMRYKAVLNIVIGLLKGFDAMQRYENTDKIQEVINLVEELKIDQDGYTPDNVVYDE